MTTTHKNTSRKWSLYAARPDFRAPRGVQPKPACSPCEDPISGVHSGNAGCATASGETEANDSSLNWPGLPRAPRLLLQATLISLFFASPAWPQEPIIRNCDTSDAMTAQLSQGYGEARELIGTTAGGRATAFLWRNPETGTWTVTVLALTGQECIQLSGGKGK